MFPRYFSEYTFEFTHFWDGINLVRRNLLSQQFLWRLTSPRVNSMSEGHPEQANGLGNSRSTI